MNVNLNTRMMAPCIPNKFMNMIQIGTTPTLTFDLSKQIIEFKDITQLKFIFKQGCMEPMCYDLYINTATKEMNPNFHYDSILESVIFRMPAEDTLNFIATYKGGGLVDFETVVIMGNNQLVYADDDSKIYVLDSLYRKTIEV